MFRKLTSVAVVVEDSEEAGNSGQGEETGDPTTGSHENCSPRPSSRFSGCWADVCVRAVALVRVSLSGRRSENKKKGGQFKKKLQLTGNAIRESGGGDEGWEKWRRG